MSKIKILRIAALACAGALAACGPRTAPAADAGDQAPAAASSPDEPQASIQPPVDPPVTTPPGASVEPGSPF
ncbi:MAG TPA: hypothetical protein VG983_03050 [Caulobacterales bacterium]|jgi:ABC-type glycerol-3-phosphate transport system substrate-binding protein|nr:hypothetical protein [Caulobacterales bacterium]